MRLFKRFKLNKIFKPKNVVKVVRMGGFALAGFIILGALTALVYAQDLPDPNKINSRAVAQSTKIYDRNDILLYEVYGEEKRTLIPFEEMPSCIKQATVAIEDKDFYKHQGVNFRGILRAAFVDITQGKSQGGSSITQQLVKNALLTNEKSIDRKIKEFILAVQIERRLSKDEILKLYLNEIPYGYNAYGIEAAAQSYFGKHAKDLTLPECAYLAALPQRPSYLNPFGNHREDLEGRKSAVLRNMVELGFLTPQQAQEADGVVVTFEKPKSGIKAPHFVMYIQEQLEEKYGTDALKTEGFKVTTTLDYEIQQMAEEAIEQNAAVLDARGASNAGLVAIDPKTGEILAMVGSRDFFDNENQGQVNIAVRPRQPGSSFKPFVYAAAFEKGYSPASMLMDVETTFGDGYRPQNYNGREYGPISMRRALAGSLNIPAVKALALVGLRDAISTASNMGVSGLSADRCGLSMVLGGCEVTLLEHTSAFAVFANGGTKYDTKSVLKIENYKGDVIFEIEEDKGRRVLNAEVAYLMNDVLSDNSARSYIFGSGSYLVLPGRPVAAKTGTTQNWRDGWTMGYTPQLAVGVWTGNMDGSFMKSGADGSAVAAPIWNSFMRKALAGKPVENFNRPPAVVDLLVDSVSGLLPGPGTTETKAEKFASFAIPTKEDNVHQVIYVNKDNGKLATTDTPEDLIARRVYTVFHSEKPDDPSWENPVRAWAAAHGYAYPPTEKDGNGRVLTAADFADQQPQDVSFQIIKPDIGQDLSENSDIEIQVPDSINVSKITVYLRDSQGSSLKLVGEQSIDTSDDYKIYKLRWQPTPDLPSGNYTIFATDDKNNKTNSVTVYIR